MRAILLGVLAMTIVVAASNYLVQIPVNDWLTWGAFTYPAAFLVTDLTNRALGPSAARKVVFAGFALAVVLSIWLATPRIAIASGTAFLAAQLLDVAIFDRLRRGAWWRAPLVSSVAASALDTALFFTLAFSAQAAFLGAGDPFETGLVAFPFGEAPRWTGWALGDFGAKLVVALAMLIPFRLALPLLRRAEA